tara:strand:+ start:10467 stop:10673 length:207 start_codon:yes stop_codon:yes gene_type:complete
MSINNPTTKAEYDVVNALNILLSKVKYDAELYGQETGKASQIKALKEHGYGKSAKFLTELNNPDDLPF